MLMLLPVAAVAQLWLDARVSATAALKLTPTTKLHHHDKACIGEITPHPSQVVLLPLLLMEAPN